MRITTLSLTNFRSFRETQTIEFAPVTLLFGPNSVGKSSVLMALFYVQHILEKGDCNPLRLESLGNKYVGGFEGLVHGRNMNESIRIRIDYDKGDFIGNTYNHIRELIEYDDLNEDIEWLFKLPDVSGTVRKLGVELTIDWSAKLKNAYVSECKLWLDETEFASMASQPDGQQTFIESINYLHPLLTGDEHDDWLEQCFDGLENIHTKNGSRAFALKGHEVPQAAFEDDADNGMGVSPDDWPDDVPWVSDSAYASLFHQLLNESRLLGHDPTTSSNMSAVDDAVFTHVPIGYENICGAIPLIGRLLKTTLDYDNRLQGTLVNELLSDAIIPAFDNLLSLLQDSLCIGPLRHIPDATYQSSSSPCQADWYDGKASWDALAKNNYSLAMDVSRWLSEEERLNLGYKLAFNVGRSESRLFEPSHKISSMEDLLASMEASNDEMTLTGSLEDVEKNPDTRQKPISVEKLRELTTDIEPTKSLLYLGGYEAKTRKLTLWDIQNKIEVSASDIGVGVSQLLPLVVAALEDRNGLVACEQPELHVHPRVQVAIGDLLTQHGNQTNFLIETHSELLILRLRRRIRQSSDGNLPDGFRPVKADDVSIVYLEPSESGVKANRIHLDEDGEFKERWPKGFFVERREELM
jgi:hypothetical protein